MKTLFLAAFLLFTTSKVPVQEKELIGTINVYMNENDEIEVHYTGNYQKCFTIYLIKRVCSECDSTLNESYLDSIFQFRTIDTVPTVKPIKTTRM